MYNRVILMGRIATDLVMRKTVAGTPVLPFRLAVDRAYQQKNEEKITDFISVIAWQNLAEFIAKNFVKGSMILVEGELQTRNYKDKDGKTVYVTEIIANRATFTGERKEKGG